VNKIANSAFPDLYSDAHPEYEEPEEVAPLETETETEPEPETDTEKVSAPSTNGVDLLPSVVAESYVLKMVLFSVILASVAWYIRRRRSGSTVCESEKNTA
jgi:hypothetical protein